MSLSLKHVLTGLLGLFVLLGVAYVGLSLTARPAEPHPFFEGDRDGVLVMAHQGGDGLWPSNTLYAFRRAVAAGADVLELDVHASQDGALVVIHDDTLDRTTDGGGLVKDKTLAELKKLDAGYDWSPERTGESFPYRGRGITIPTLEEVFEAFPDTRVNVEIKQTDPDIVGPLCDLVERYGREDTTLVVSFYDAATRAFRERCPDVATAATPNEIRTFFILTTLFVDRAYLPQAQALQVPEAQGNLRLVTRRLTRAAHRKNVQVHVWTVDDAADMARLLDWGVDGIITDRPDRLLKVLGRGDVFERPDGVPE